MFDLTENDFIISGICRYKDEYENTAFMKRTDDGFVAKLRFKNPNASAEPVTVKMPIPDDERGQVLNLIRKDNNDSTVNKGIEHFIALINYWISLLNDIHYTECDNSILAKDLGFYENEEWNLLANQYKMNLLCQYPELKDIIEQTFDSEMSKRLQ